MITIPKYATKKSIFIYTEEYRYCQSKKELLSGTFNYHSIENRAVVYIRENDYDSSFYTFLFYSNDCWFMKTGCSSEKFSEQRAWQLFCANKNRRLVSISTSFIFFESCGFKKQIHFYWQKIGKYWIAMVRRNLDMELVR